MTTRSTGPVARAAVIAAVVTAVLAAFVPLVRRMMRAGVYALPEGLEIRDVGRTRVFPWTTILGTSTQRRWYGRNACYLPTLVVRLEPKSDRRALLASTPDLEVDDDHCLIVLKPLTALTNGTAQRRAAQVESMIESYRPRYA